MPDGPAPASDRRASRAEPADLAYRYRWVLTAAGLLILSLAIVLYARARPGYDPYGWLVWGKLTLHLKLDTNGAPSWKPLPFLFTVPYALVGHYALWLWMVTSVAISLSGLIFAWRIAFRLTYSRPERRYASYVAGLVAAGVVLVDAGSDCAGQLRALPPERGVRHDDRGRSASPRSTCIWSGRHRLGLLDVVPGRRSGRPEVWPFLGLAGLWLWWKDPAYRRWLYAALGLLRRLLVRDPGDQLQELLHRRQHRPELAAGDPRQQDHRHDRPLPRAGGRTRCGSWRLLTVAWAAWRRRIAILVLAAGALAWLVIEIAFALKGFPAVPRYLFEAGAVVAILAGVFVGRVVHELPGLIAALRQTDRRGPDIPAAGQRCVGTWGTLSPWS